MRMPNMSHRAPTLNNEQETSRKSFFFRQPVIARTPRSYLCTSVDTTQAVLHTHTSQQEKKPSVRQATHVDEHIQTETQCNVWCTCTQRLVMPRCAKPTIARKHTADLTPSAAGPPAGGFLFLHFYLKFNKDCSSVVITAKHSYRLKFTHL